HLQLVRRDHFSDTLPTFPISLAQFFVRLWRGGLRVMLAAICRIQGCQFIIHKLVSSLTDKSQCHMKLIREARPVKPPNVLDFITPLSEHPQLGPLSAGRRDAAFLNHLSPPPISNSVFGGSVMNSTIPADLHELKTRFETWRTNRKYLREPIPNELWNAAADLSRRYPPSLVGRVLKLDSSRLQKFLL